MAGRASGLVRRFTTRSVGALAAARLSGWEGLLAEQRSSLDEFWQGADVEVDGDAEIQQAVRFALFHVLQAGIRAESFPIAAKGVTGPGYDGDAFWDTEIFVLPVLTFTHAPSARDALEWRRSILPLAKERAAQLGLAGAAFLWRTIHGEECSAYWPAGTAAFHINADIADAVVRYLDATGDEEFAAESGLELLVETARFWRSLGHHDADGRFRIDGVTGPDETARSPTTTCTRISWQLETCNKRPTWWSAGFRIKTLT
jgi:alpha,alpha-trehalose phosphorylase